MNYYRFGIGDGIENIWWEILVSYLVEHYALGGTSLEWRKLEILVHQISKYLEHKESVMGQTQCLRTEFWYQSFSCDFNYKLFYFKHGIVELNYQ